MELIVIEDGAEEGYIPNERRWDIPTVAPWNAHFIRTMMISVDVRTD